MKKIGILTINDDRNYGNRLQNYAVQESIKKYGFIVETIHNKNGIVGFNVILRNIKKIIKRELFFVKKCRRSKSFMDFDRNISYSKNYIDKNMYTTVDLNNEYDNFITGSDQVWNPYFGRMSDIDFLCFADKKKRNSFSASFGISDIPNDLKDYYKNKLTEMNNISVREERGKEIVEELTGRKDIEVLIDPTMILTSEEWDLVSKKPKQIKKIKNKKYILNYFLGGLSEKRRNEITKIAKENNCEVINLLDKSDPFYTCGPSEFLYLEKNAFLICTDSFHSCVFAFLFNKPFVIFNREKKEAEKMNSRIDTLINKFQLKNRKYNGSCITKENMEHDYTESYKILEKERIKCDLFLKKVLDIKDCD